MLYLPLPLKIRRRAFLIVEVSRKWKSSAFIETSLIEEVGGFERVKIACDLRRAGEDDTCVDAVGSLGRSLAYWWDMLRSLACVCSSGSCGCVAA